MRLRNIPGSREAIAESQWCIKDPELCRGEWRGVFMNNNPIHIEIGMGKGRFLMEMAEKNPGINYVGIEKYSSVLLRALQKMEENPLPNARFIRMDAESICGIFDKGEVSKIYLNFSDPWPKERHAKRRLTSRQYFSRYDSILSPDGTVEFKTDNADLFTFSLDGAESAGWRVVRHTWDLHRDAAMMDGNVMTEYEERFSAMGKPICKMVASRP